LIEDVPPSPEDIEPFYEHVTLQRGHVTFSLLMVPLDDVRSHLMMMGHLDVTFGAS
jgi:hypothetical protein